MINKKVIIGLAILLVLSGLTIWSITWSGHPGYAENIVADAPYSQRGPYNVGVRETVIKGETPLDVVFWYPAEYITDQNESRVYPYQIKMGEPFGTVTMAWFAGQAITDAPFDLSSAPYPLVVLSPGFSISSQDYAWLAEHLASYGFFVISPDHDEQLDPENQLWRSAITRPKDIITIFNYVDTLDDPGSKNAGLVDGQNVAVIGHSYGGYTSLAAAGAQINTMELETHCEYMRQIEDSSAWLCDMLLPHLDDMADLAMIGSVPDGSWPSIADPRVDAIVPIAGDAFFFGESGLSEITIPIMAIGGTADEDSPFEWNTKAAYENSASQKKVEIALQGANHMIITAQCDSPRWFLKPLSGEFCSDSEWERGYAHGLVKHFTAAFLLAELKQDSDAATFLKADNVNILDISYQSQGY